jgi:hypothetical protein
MGCVAPEKSLFKWFFLAVPIQIPHVKNVRENLGVLMVLTPSPSARANSRFARPIYDWPSKATHYALYALKTENPKIQAKSKLV